MTGYITLALLFVIPYLLVAVRQINVIFVYVSIVGGNLMLTALGDDAGLAASGLIPWKYSAMAVQLMLLMLPLIFSAVFSKKTVHGKMYALQLLPKMVCILMLCTFALGILPSSVQLSVYALPFGDVLRRSQDIIVGLATILVLLVMWHGYRVKDHGHKGRK